MQQDRPAIRAKVRSLRNALSTREQLRAEVHLASVVSAQPCFLKSRRLGFYMANDGELNPGLTMAIALAAGKSCYLPVLHPVHSKQLHFARYRHNTPMQTNCYGIPEPRLRAARLTPVWTLDILFLPLVAFDHLGNRLGMGGGYYDRTLAASHGRGRHKPLLIGIAHSVQELDILPAAAWDVPLHGVATEQQFMLFGANRSN